MAAHSFKWRLLTQGIYQESPIVLQNQSGSFEFKELKLNFGNAEEIVFVRNF